MILYFWKFLLLFYFTDLHIVIFQNVLLQLKFVNKYYYI